VVRRATGGLQGQPLKAIRFYALRYAALRDRFNRAYAALARERQVLDKWYDEDRRGRVGGNMEILREKKRIIGYLLTLRKVLFVFERVHFRLSELEEYWRQGYGEGTLEGSLTSRPSSRPWTGTGRCWSSGWLRCAT